MGSNEGPGCDADVKWVSSGTVGESARATKAFPASRTGVGLAPWGAPSDPADKKPGSAVKILSKPPKIGLPKAVRKSVAWCALTPPPISPPTAGARPSPAACVEGIDQGRRSAGERSPTSPPSLPPHPPFPPPMPGDVHLPLEGRRGVYTTLL